MPNLPYMCRDAGGCHDPRRHSHRITAVAIRVTVMLLVLGLADTVWAKMPTVSAPAPDFALKSSSGDNLRLSEFRGDVVIVNFWSAHCGRCRDQLSQLNKLGEDNPSNRIKILSINVDSDSTAAVRTMGALDLGFSVLFDTDKIVARLYDPSQLPMTVVVDAHGMVRYIHESFRGGEEALYRRELAELLAE